MLLAWLASTALAYELVTTDTGAPLQWPEMPVAFHIDTAEAPKTPGAAAQANAIRRSFEAWEEVEAADVVFSEEDSDAVDGTVEWITDWPWDEDVLAMTTTSATSDGTIVEFRIRINARDVDWTVDGASGHDIQNAMTHEVGHLLGLAHNPDNDHATMYPSAVEGERGKRDLHFDDEDGTRFLYPLTGASYAAGCSTTGALPTTWALLLPLLAFVRRSR